MLSLGGAAAQSGTSTLRGTVVDQQGNAVTGASVTLSNTEKNVIRTQTTNADGGFVFSSVPPGVYRVEVEAAGFKKALAADVRAVVDTPVDVNVQLEAGNITEVVSVSAGLDAPINTTDATIGNTFESRRIEELPLNARNIVGLLSLQPGVTSGGAVNGGRADQSNITLDGVDVNEQQAGLDVVATTVTGINQAFGSVLRVTPDSVQEFRVVTTNPNAEQGRSSGAQVSLVTKSGTNQLHGSLYHFHRNTVTTANDFFNNKAGTFGPNDPQVLSGTAVVGDPRVPRPPLLRNIFGGSVGGPIKKDRAYFFFTYEGFREATSTSAVKVVPLASTIGQGIIRYRSASGASDPSCPAGTPAGFRCLTPAQIDAAYLAANGVSPGTNALAINYLANIARRYPANDTTVGDGINTGGFRFNARTPTNQDTFIGKLDFNLTSRQTMFVRGNYQDDLVKLAPDLPDTVPPQIWYHPKGLAVGHTWVVTNRLVNKVTYGFTRAAFSQQGESTDPNVSFRFIFQPGTVAGIAPARTLTRVTPVHNIVDDLSWSRGNHTIQFGGNLRFIENRRSSFTSSYDFATTNPSGYEASSAVLTTSVNNTPIFADVAQSSVTPLRNALAAFIGRFSQYNASIQYDPEGNILPPGSPADRTFATEEYELYGQDSWRIRPNFTLNLGLRWSTTTPVYEANGFQVQPVQSLGEFFERRIEGMETGVPYNELLTLDRSGKANDRPGFYKQDWNNFGPSVSFAWSPDFGDNFLGRLVGRDGKSVLRGGFRMTFDRVGSQLAVSFDLNNSLGFNSAPSTSAGQFNVTDALPPLFTTLTPNVRTLPFIAGTFDERLIFPLTEPADNSERIQASLDDSITTPYNYSVNLSYAREIGKGLSFEASFVGRYARDLLAQRDVMHFNNIRDPRSGQNWYDAIRQLIDHRYAATPITSVPAIPFFENLLPGIAGTFAVNGVNTPLTATQSAYRRIALASVGGQNVTDYTFLQSNLRWNNRPFSIFDNTFVHPQYATLMVWSTIAKSNYNAGQFSLRQRFRNDLTFDLNYTLSNSHDNASGLQNAGFGSTTALIFDPTNVDSNYANSDFDVRHIINANWLYGLPIGRGKAFLSDLPRVANAVLGGWQLTGIFRWNSGLPTAAFRPFAFQRWATNWQISSGMVATRPVTTTSGDVNGEPNIFADPQAAFLSYRDPLPGEPGDRNKLRYPGYVSLDAALHKTFHMPWEGHRVTFRWEVFNVT
ncbi:MAG TPA: TonB-dependent receptor, partial [Pyrinomonadaceae bacterium]